MTKLKNILAHWKTVLTAIVGIMVVIPSILNAAHDIWGAWQDLPVGEKEKINSAMFKKHYKDNPIHTKQIIIDSRHGKRAITLDIYKNGDILIDYVKFVQWFPIEDKISYNKGFELISSAHAGFFFTDSEEEVTSISEAVDSTSKNITNEIKSNNIIERKRTLSDGTVVTQTINTNTGKIISVTHTKPDDVNYKEHNDSDDITGIDVIKTQ